MSSFIDIVNKDYELMSGGASWESRVQEESGKTYYYDTETNETQWNMPPDPKIINTELKTILENTKTLKLNVKTCQETLKEKEEALKHIQIKLSSEMEAIKQKELKLEEEMKITTENKTENENLTKELTKLQNEKDTLIYEHKTFLADITPTIRNIIKTLKEQ